MPRVTASITNVSLRASSGVSTGRLELIFRSILCSFLFDGLLSQAFKFLNRENDHHWAPVFLDNNRLGACGIDQPAELVLRVTG
jgi:hypothetical protein